MVPLSVTFFPCEVTSRFEESLDEENLRGQKVLRSEMVYRRISLLILRESFSTFNVRFFFSLSSRRSESEYCFCELRLPVGELTKSSKYSNFHEKGKI